MYTTLEGHCVYVCVCVCLGLLCNSWHGSGTEGSTLLILKKNTQPIQFASFIETCIHNMDLLLHSILYFYVFQLGVLH